MNRFVTCSVLRPLSLTLLVLAAASAQAQPARSISDCRALEGELARFACYESLETPATEAAVPAAPAAAPAAPAAAAPATPPARPVSNLPVVRRPQMGIGDLTGQPAAADASANAEVRAQQEEKPGLLRRLLPFGGGNDKDEAGEAPAAAPAATAAAPGSESAVADFGRRDAAARLQTNAEGKQELIDTVASFRTINVNLLEVTLESGQVWRQMLSKRYPLNVGDSVIIRPTRWGSAYRLTSERISGYIQVERVD